MDPDALWCRLLAALESSEWDEVAEAASDLLAWLTRGGFPPQIVPDRTHPRAWSEAVVRSACEAALQCAQRSRN